LQKNYYYDLYILLYEEEGLNSPAKTLNFFLFLLRMA